MQIRFVFSSLLFLFVFVGESSSQSLNERIANYRQKRLSRIGETDRYQVSGPQLSFTSFRDQRISPNLYSGPGAGIYIRSYAERPAYVSNSNLSFCYSLLSGPSTLSSFFHRPGGFFSWEVLKKTENFSWQAGLGIRGDYYYNSYQKLRNDNSSSDGVAFLYAVANRTFSFQLLQTDAVVRSGLRIPVYSFLFRAPVYNISGTELFFAGPGKFRKLEFFHELVKDMRFSNENKVSLSYNWQIFYMEDKAGYFPAIGSTHHLALGFWLKNR